MMPRHASCACGQLRLAVVGEPIRVSICHCLSCQQRTGSVFAAQARFRRDQVTSLEGRETTFVRTGDSGGAATHHFCPVCGSTVYWVMNGTEAPYTPDYLAIAVGAFADPGFPPPTVSVYEARRHPWVTLTGADVEHWD